jgi:hypothetical protein
LLQVQQLITPPHPTHYGTSSDSCSCLSPSPSSSSSFFFLNRKLHLQINRELQRNKKKYIYPLSYFFRNDGSSYKTSKFFATFRQFFHKKAKEEREREREKEQ